jgi:hypothetical protein
MGKEIAVNFSPAVRSCKEIRVRLEPVNGDL